MNSMTNFSVLPWSEEIENDGLSLLNQYQTTSMFLLSNLQEYGSRLGEIHYSGNFKCLLADNKLVAVFVLSKDGNLLLQTDRVQDYSPHILLQIAMQCMGWSPSFFLRMKIMLLPAAYTNAWALRKSGILA